MKRRWPWVVAYALAVLIEAAVLAGAYELHLLSRAKMGVMRYLFAQNLTLEASWFSPDSVLIQIAAFLVIAIASVAVVLVLWRLGARFAMSQTVVLAALAATGAWLASSFSAEGVPALYAALAALWVATALQGAVVAVAARRARARARTTAQQPGL